MTSDKSFLEIQEAPIRAMKKLKLGFVASKRIRDDPGFTMISVTGVQRGGKSVYALRILAELYNHDIDKVLDNTVFTIEAFTSKIKHALDNNYRIPALLFDDASVHLSAAVYGESPKAVLQASRLGDTLGIACKSLILTSPSSDLIKAFRNYKHYRVSILQGRHTYDRIARAYIIGHSPLGQKWIRTEWEDHFDTRLPFYERYATMRKEISLAVLSDKPEDSKESSIISTICDFMINKPEWKGTASDLLGSLPGNDLPDSPSALMRLVNKNVYKLKVKGLLLEQSNNGKVKSITLSKTKT